MAGIPYRCATTVNSAYNCQALNTHPELKKTPSEWGDLVRNAYPGYTGPRPRVVIFHGSSDAIVSPDNQIELVEQWTNVLGADQTADETATIAGHERVRHKVGGATVVESWRVASMGHAVSMGADPEHACPPSGGTYIENRGMCAAWRAAAFFGLTGAVTPPQDGGMPDGGMPPDGGTPGAPAVTITAPGDGDEVSGAVTISAEASAADGVARVEFKVDGVLKGSDGTAPYSYRWQTANVGAGTHAIEAIVYDRWEVMASDEIEVMVDEGGGNPDDPTRVDPIPCGCSGGGAGAVGLGVVVLLLVGFFRRRRVA
jgi:MYXO-CTERM domain-containing protein